MISIAFDEQDPNDELVYEISLAVLLASIAPLTIVSVSWSVASIIDDATPMQIHAQSAEPDFSLLRVRLGEGTLGYKYRVSALLTLSDGERKTISFHLPIGYT